MAESFTAVLTELDENAILTQLNTIAQELGLINEIFTTSRIYVYYAVFARVFGNLSQIIVQYLNSVDIENTTDEAVLELQVKPFVNKRYAKVAKVILEFSRRSTYDGNNEDIIIPRNFEVTTEGDNPIVFRTAESRILWKDSYRVLIPAYSVEFGSLNNVSANTLTYFDDGEIYNIIKVTNPNAAYGGTDEETAFDTRERIGLFRYGRNATKEAIQELLFENGVSYYGFNIVEYWDGFGTVLICMDVDSEERFNDIVANIEAQKPAAVKYHYCMADYVLVNVDVTIKMTGENIYTEYQKDEVAQHIKTGVELFFANQIYVGKALSVNRLQSFLLQYLYDERYDIYEVDVEIEGNNNFTIDNVTGQIQVEEFQRLYPNIVYTKIDYDI